MKFSLKRKIALFIVVNIAIMGAIVLALFDYSLKQIEVSEYTRQSIDLAQTVATVLDARSVETLRNDVASIYNDLSDKVSSDEWGTPEFEAYLDNFAPIERTGAFLTLRSQLRSIQASNHVDSLYLMYLDESTHAVVYLVDAAYEDVCRPGTFDILLDDDLAIFESPEQGFDPSISNTEEYGWNIATARPIFNDERSIVGYACVDISMNDIVTQRHATLRRITLFLLAITALVIIGGIVLAGRYVVRPINELSQASLRYFREGAKAGGHLFSDLNIHTGDEIEILASSMAKMEGDLHAYAKELRHMANSDSLTRVRNKRAYDIEIERAGEELKEHDTPTGIAVVDLNNLKSINDTYGHDKGDVTLKVLCTLICTVFDHSPVFRIGGDEFAIVLRGHDLEHVDELIARANETMAARQRDSSLDPWEKASAAIGYAVFDPTKDTSLDPVFNRADKAMYERKRVMKGNVDD